MRIECTACREVADASFAIVNGSIAITCVACQEIVTVTARPVRAKTEPSPVCPKCGTTRNDEPACPSCGLAAANMKAFAANRDVGVPDGVRAAWTRACSAWDQIAVHDALLQLVAMENAYAWAAARYREIQRARPGDTVATRQLDRLRRAAEATMFASTTVRADRSPKPYRATIMVMAILLAVLAAGLVYSLIAQNGPGPQVRPRPDQGPEAPRGAMGSPPPPPPAATGSEPPPPPPAAAGSQTR